ncbi:MAG: response regulator [Armatimonadota bacterium]|nr:response regulator [Armatimonadota bacterium]
MTRKILIIEDEPEIQAILSMSLQHAGGFDVILANDGIEGIEMALDQSPDLILLDVLMPKLDGYATCRRIKQNERISNIPVIFLTAKTDPHEVDRAMRAGASGYVAKPFDPLKLAGQIARIADGGANVARQSFRRHRRGAH